MPGHGATNIHSKEKKRLPSKTMAPDRVRRPLWRGAWMTDRAPRDRCRLPAPPWCDGGASSLRRSPHGCAGLRGRAGKAAPPVRVPRATPGLPTDCELRRTGRSTDRFSTDQGHPEEEEAEDHQETTGRRLSTKTDFHPTTLASRPLRAPFYSSSLIAPPSF